MSISIPYRMSVDDEDGVRMSNMNPEEDFDDVYGLGVVIDCNSGIGCIGSDVAVVSVVELDDGDSEVGMVVIGTTLVSSSDGLVGAVVAVVLMKEEDDDDDDDVVDDDDTVGDNVVAIDMEIEAVSDNDTEVLELVPAAAASDNGSDGCSALSSILDDDEVVGASVVAVVAIEVAAVGDIVGRIPSSSS